MVLNGWWILTQDMEEKYKKGNTELFSIVSYSLSRQKNARLWRAGLKNAIRHYKAVDIAFYKSEIHFFGHFALTIFTQKIICSSDKLLDYL